MIKTKGGLTYEEEKSLLDRLDSGDEDALREAQLLSAQLAKRANVRLKALEDANYRPFEFRRAKYFLKEDFGREKFSESKKLTGDELKEQIELLNRFLNAESQTTLAPLRKESEKKTERALERAGILPEDTGAAKRRELHKFLRSDAFKEVKATYTGTEGGTGGYLVAAVDAIEKGAKFSDLQKMYDDYKDKLDDGEDVSIFDIMDDWLVIEDED